MSNGFVSPPPLFFLFPQSIVQEDIVKGLVFHEIAAYLIRDPLVALQLLLENPNGQLFFNADSTYSDKEWINFVDKIRNSEKLARVTLTIMAFKSSGELIDTYCRGDEPKCRFIKLETNNSPLQEILAQVEQYHQKDRRKTLRLRFDNANGSRLKITMEGISYQGSITDISSAGMVCTVSDNTLFQKNTLLEDITILHDGRGIPLSGYVAGHYTDGRKKHVVIFTNTDNHYNRKLLYEFIYEGLQKEIQGIISSLKKR